MSPQASVLREGVLLPIRTVHVLSGDGAIEDLRSVRCPADVRSVRLADCLECVDCGGVVTTPSPRGERVRCRHVAAEVREHRGGDAVVDHTPVSAVMTTEVVAVGPDVTLESATGLLLERGIGGLPVVDERGHPIGVVSGTDLLDERYVAGDTSEALARGWHASRGHYRLETGPGVHVEAIPNDTVADVMTRAVFSLPEGAPVAQAAALMAVRGVHRVLVVGDDGRLSGIVTSSDVVRWVAERGGFLPVTE